MKDIDFDELDRAVSSVLETPEEQTTTSDAPVVTPPTPVVEEPKKAEVKTESTPTTTTTTPPAAKTPLAIKRRGQFMDVVHPSSDMTSKGGSETPAAPAAPAPKVTLSPISENVVPETPAETVEAAAKEEVEPTPASAAVADVENTPASDAAEEPASSDRAWPDPLDVMKSQEEAKDTTVEDTAVEASTEPVSTTPFLSDTKVDKRPLGGFSAEEMPAAGVMTADPAPSEPLPPELQPEIVAVEASVPEQSSESPETPDESQPAVSAAEKTSTPEPSFNASIPQQYVAAENQADEDHSIFDTREYHQPLIPAHAKKRGLPGWLLAIILIVVLAGVGAAGGYFWFYYGL